MKTTITTLDNGDVRISYDDPDSFDFDTNEPTRVTREFTVASSGGYVYEYLPRGERTQVCGHLGYRGNTLTATSDGAALASVIRREYRALRARQRRDAAATW